MTNRIHPFLDVEGNYLGKRPCKLSFTLTLWYYYGDTTLSILIIGVAKGLSKIGLTMVDELMETAVLPALTTKWLGHVYLYYLTLGSTNDELKRLLAEGNELPTGTVVLTDFQSQGRGRLNRGWFVPPQSSLLHSILFRPDWPAIQANWLTMMVGVAAAEAIEAATGLTVGLKWPNDVMVQQGDEWHKVSGILLEGQVTNGRLQQAIVGIGINVNVPAGELPATVTPATSLLIATGRPVARLPLLLDFWQRLERYYEVAQSPHTAWQRRLITLGQQVQISQIGQPPVIGRAETADIWGQLLVRDETGNIHTIAAGDVTLRREA
jgi:BirA family biotin operon repressor/biotin-[acetyl-CoA-carboxylase] ligase